MSWRDLEPVGRRRGAVGDGTGLDHEEIVERFGARAVVAQMRETELRRGQELSPGVGRAWVHDGGRLSAPPGPGTEGAKQKAPPVAAPEGRKVVVLTHIPRGARVTTTATAEIAEAMTEAGANEVVARRIMSGSERTPQTIDGVKPDLNASSRSAPRSCQIDVTVVTSIWLV